MKELSKILVSRRKFLYFNGIKGNKINKIKKFIDVTTT